MFFLTIAVAAKLKARARLCVKGVNIFFFPHNFGTSADVDYAAPAVRCNFMCFIFTF